ncbi:MAG TPA: hypothetical protein ACFE0H_01980 [Elainellaceae cyanobacterium]
MAIETVGNPPPEADQLRAEIEKQLPNIIASFSQVLQDQFGFEGLRVGGFTLVPAEAAENISCDEEGCSVD